MRKDDRASCVHLTCSNCLVKVLPLAYSNSLSRRTVTKTRTDEHTSPLQIILHLLISLRSLKIFLRKNDYFITRIIGYKIFGVIANLLVPSRACIYVANWKYIIFTKKKNYTATDQSHSIPQMHIFLIYSKTPLKAYARGSYYTHAE